MLTKLTGIVLQTIRHNDRNDIVTLFTRQRGRVALLVGAGNGKTARMRRARLSPLALIETEVNFRETRDLQFIGEISSPHLWRNLYFDPVKGAMTVFMAEFLNRLLRASEADEPMWRFLLSALHSLDTLERGISNYHIAFLIRLLPFAGISPDLDSYRPGRVFDMQDGSFADIPPLHRHFIPAAEAAYIPLLMRMNFMNLHRFRFNVGQRRQLLQWLLRYYSLHLPVGEDLKSLEVLRDVFN